MRDFTHVDDIIDALMLILKKQTYGYDFELGRGFNYSVNEVSAMFRIKPIYKPPKPGEARTTLCTSRLARDILGWDPKLKLTNYIKNELLLK